MDELADALDCEPDPDVMALNIIDRATENRLLPTDEPRVVKLLEYLVDNDDAWNWLKCQRSGSEPPEDIQPGMSVALGNGASTTPPRALIKGAVAVLLAVLPSPEETS